MQLNSHKVSIGALLVYESVLIHDLRMIIYKSSMCEQIAEACHGHAGEKNRFPTQEEDWVCGP